MGYLGTKPANQITDSTLIADGTITTSDLASGLTVNFADGSASTPSITNDGDTNTGIFFPAADTIAFAEGGAEIARFDSSGNLGINTTSPTTGRLVIAQSNATQPAISLPTDESTIQGPSANTQIRMGGNLVMAGAGIATINTAGSERMRIDSSGNLLLGTTSAAGMLTIRQRANSDTVFRLQDNNGNNRTTVLPSGFFGYMWGIQIYSNGGKAFLFTNASDSEVGNITVNSGSVNYNSTSDYRLKESVAPMTGALAKVSALKPCTYTWKADGSYGQGFIAHELAEVCPDAVTGEKDAVDAEGKPKYQGIDTSFLVATLTAAIQEQQAIITDLKARIETLENK